VIFGSGEEIAAEFDATKLPALPAHWKRDYFFYANGFVKDMDWWDASPFTVAQLPFHAMSAYPYPDSEEFPQDAQSLDYQLNWNDRFDSGEPVTACIILSTATGTRRRPRIRGHETMEESEIQELAESPRAIGAARKSGHLQLVFNAVCILVILWLARGWLLRANHWLDGHSQKEIARRLGISSGALGSLYFLVHTVPGKSSMPTQRKSRRVLKKRRNNSIRAITPSRNGIRRAGAMSGMTIEPATRQLELLRAGEISVTELAEAHIRQIERLNPQLNVFADFDAERVRERARKHDAWRGTRSQAVVWIAGDREVIDRHARIQVRDRQPAAPGRNSHAKTLSSLRVCARRER
jgi:hypothetical protein